MLIVSPKKVVGRGGGNQDVEGDLLTFGHLILDDALGYPYYRLISVEWVPSLKIKKVLGFPTSNVQRPTSNVQRLIDVLMA